MSESGASDRRSAALQPHVFVASLLAVLLITDISVAARFQISSLLIRNWLLTLDVVCVILITMLWPIPRWAPKLNKYLWTGSRHVTASYSAAVVLVAFAGSFTAIFGVLYIGQFRHPEMTVNWRVLWSLGVAAAIVPVLIAFYAGLARVGVTRQFRWLDVGRWLVVSGGSRFNDLGRIMILSTATLVISMIQGSIVLTGGLSISPFAVLLVFAGNVAALATVRPAYSIFTATIALCAAGFTEIVGSYPPPVASYYPTAHLAMFTLALMVALLIDLGEKARARTSVRQAKRRRRNVSTHRPEHGTPSE